MAKKTRWNYSTTFAFENKEGVEVEVEINANILPYVPGKLSGPPENCYPPEGGECDDWSLTLDGQPLSDKDFEEMGGNLDSLRSSVEESAAQEQADADYYGPDDPSDD